jgi:3-isopropylmalate dehydrogenase
LGETAIGLYEPIHGSAPDIAGKGIANPIGTILSTAMMLRHSFKLESEALAVEQAVEQTITLGARTADIGGTLTTRQMTDEIIKNL